MPAAPVGLTSYLCHFHPDAVTLSLSAPQTLKLRSCMPIFSRDAWEGARLQCQIREDFDLGGAEPQISPSTDGCICIVLMTPPAESPEFGATFLYPFPSFFASHKYVEAQRAGLCPELRRLVCLGSQSPLFQTSVILQTTSITIESHCSLNSVLPCAKWTKRASKSWSGAS